MPDNSNQIDKPKDCKTRGFGLSFCVLLHSHLYWFYSILYIAYHQITLDKKSVSANDRAHKKKAKHSHHHQRHAKRKSLTLKPKAVIIPCTKLKTNTIAKPNPLTEKPVPVVNGESAKDAPFQQKAPLLQALRTFPSSSSKKTLHIHQLIKSHSETVKRSNSTGHIRTRHAAGLLHSEEETSSDESSIRMQSLSISKRDRAIGLLRSTFHRSNSTGHLKQGLDSSFSSEDEGGAVIKKRKRDTIFALTRKFSGRKNVPTAIVAAETTTTTTTDGDQSFETDANKLPLPNNTSRSKLFRNLASWKKGQS
ncbi:hypothetical protein [Parasitella parasitica]|uniref:Uncharacterized protein n=1 Tax=Parasitella parasitica TaxID=35722 RepID=A0A0B7N1P6_9FUNG|nr:hypothetical protein [Parasitella parasitica]